MSEQRRPTARLGRKRDPRADSLPPAPRKSTDSKRELPAASDEGHVADVDELLGRLLARATQAEVHAQHLEQTLARVNEERVLLEARVAELTRQLEDADAQRASLEAQLRATPSRRSEAPVTLSYVRTMAAELVRALDRVQLRSSSSDLPVVRPHSDLPTRR